MKIRTANPADAHRLAGLMAGGALVPKDLDDTEAIAEALAEIARTPGSDVLVAEVDGRVVGMCQLITFRHVQHGGGLCAEIESLHVHSDHRSSGIGGALLEEAVSRAREAGCYRVQLTSNTARSDAHRFYEGHGFQPTHVGFKRLLD